MTNFRHAFRQLAKSPGFVAVAVFSLALGIGANTAVFSLVNDLLLNSLPLPNPQELRVIQWSGANVKIRQSSGRFVVMGGRTKVPGVEAYRATKDQRTLADAFPYPVFSRLRADAATSADVFAHADLRDITARARREAFTGRGLLVSDNFFRGLGVRPVLGRLFVDGDEKPGTEPIVVISHAWWEMHFDRDPEVVGQPLTLSGHSFTVVGVLPGDFRGVRLGGEVEFVAPLSAQPVLQPSMSLASTDQWWLQLMARVRPGASEAQWQTSLDAVFAQESAAHMTAPRLEIEAGHSGPDYARNYFRKPFMILLGVVAAVILVACANLAGLSLARAAGRRHEFAIRAALGCGRWHLIRQSLTESLILAGAGGLVGVIVALWGRTLLSHLFGGLPVGPGSTGAMNLTVLGFALALTLLTAVLAGVLPAWRAGNVDPLEGLKTGSAQARPHLRTGRLLVVAQIAISALLLTGAGLYGRTLVNLVRIDPGFAVDHLLLVRLNPGASGYQGPARAQFYARAQEALTRLPAVRGVALTQFALLSGSSSSGSFEIPAHPPASRDPRTWPNAYRLTVGENFFATLGLPVVFGRGFTAADTDGTPRVAVINEALARKYFPDENPIGLTLKSGEDEWTIVGVCRDARYSELKQAVPPTVYYSYRQNAPGFAYIALRTALPPRSLVPAVRKTMAAVDPNVPLAEITTQEAMRDGKIRQERMFATLVGALAGLAVLLACIGLYGLLAYNVARRTPEFGLRSALGAQRGDIARPIVREALGLAALGLALGCPAAIALAQIIRHQLYGVEPFDPLTLISGAILLLAVATFAAWIPARRASRVDPLVALRA